MGAWKDACAGWLGNLLLASASCLATLLAMEAGARIARAVEGRRGPWTDFSAYTEYDPLLGWRKRAGARLVFRRPEYTVPIAINSLGLRDPERGYEPSPETTRILVLGDSFVEGYTVPLPQTVTQDLEASLDAAGGRAVQVINGATAGYSTDQEVLFYESEGVRYRPQVVVLFFCYNDVLYNDSQWYYGGAPKPVFVFREGRLEVWKRPVPRPAQGPQPPPTEAPRRVRGSVFLRWVRGRLWFGAPRLYNRLGRLGLWPPNRPLGPRADLGVYSRQRNPEIESGWEKTDALLRRLERAVAEQGARLLVVYVPSRMEINDRTWQLSREKYAMNDSAWDRSSVLLRLAAILRSAGIPLLDLTAPLRKADGFLAGPYYPNDGHWNALGHRVAAGELRRWLLDRGWLRGSAGPADSASRSVR